MTEQYIETIQKEDGKYYDRVEVTEPRMDEREISLDALKNRYDSDVNNLNINADEMERLQKEIEELEEQKDRHSESYDEYKERLEMLEEVLPEEYHKEWGNEEEDDEE